ncbi:hypothetical protein B0H17DRAFT_1293847 [Mycena rosella]|uniref:Uncharacterized protein n=1 Tax=Mycena rosella TaxID=1033263 RepID=A0AAD7GVG9_MYCRO|nr:hypothetical protein B0H17DRAFT_1293847 [Mycena rosella]
MSDEQRERAAKQIQQLWRSKHQQNSDFLTTTVRLNDAKVHATLTAARAAAEAGHNTPQARWRRAIDFAIRLQDGNTMLTQNGVQTAAPSKFLETQHWLELVDGKHRYGSNLKACLGCTFRLLIYLGILSGTTGAGSRKIRRKTSSSGLTRGEENPCRSKNVPASSWTRSESRKLRVSIAFNDDLSSLVTFQRNKG